MSGNSAEGGDLGRYMQPYWRRRWLVLAILVLVPALVYGISKLTPKSYEADTTLLIRDTNFSSQAFTEQISIAGGNAESASILIQTTPVAVEAARELGDPPSAAGTLLGQITVTPDISTSGTGTQFLTIAAEDEDPDRAADVANAFATAITDRRTSDAEAEISRAIRLLEERSEELGNDSGVAQNELIAEIQQLEGLLAAQRGTTQVIEPALPPVSPVSPRPLRNTALAIVLALLIAAGVVPLADRISRELRSADELEETTGSQLLAQVPESAFPGNPPSAVAREAFQTLRASLRYFNLDQSLGAVLIASPARGEGKTTVAVNLGLALARDGEKVIIVDADLRQPRVAARLGARGSHGIEAVLVDGVRLDDALEEVNDGAARLLVLGSTTPAPNPAMLLSSGRMKELLADLAERADIVIVDTPPVLAVSDAIPLMAEVSGIVLVSRVNQSTIDAISRTREVIASAQGKILGVVATGTKGGGLYGDAGDYGDYVGGYPSPDESAAEAPTSNGKTPATAGSPGSDVAPVAGWYPDPEAPGMFRYWNGREWTADRSSAAEGGDMPSLGASSS